MNSVASSPVDVRPHELRSIANSIEPAFPDAASQLRAIARSIEKEKS